MATLLYDTFTGTDGTNLTAHTMNVGPGWTSVSGSIVTQSNKAVPGDSGQEIYVSDAGAADVTAEVVATTTVGGDMTNNTGLVFRYADDSHYWLARINGSNSGGISAQIFENNGGFTLRDSQAVSLALGTAYTLSVVASGTAVSFKIDGVEKASYASMGTGLTNTKCGLWVRDQDGGGVALDNFLVTGGSPPPPPAEGGGSVIIAAQQLMMAG